MSTVGIFPSEPIPPQAPDMAIAAPRSGGEKHAPADRFDSVLAGKQKSSKCVDEPPQGLGAGEATAVTEVTEDVETNPQSDPPADEVNSKDATVDPAMGYLLAILPEQKLPPEKFAASQKVPVSSGEILPDEPVAEGNRPPTNALFRLADAAQEPLAAKPVMNETPLQPALAMVGEPAKTTPSELAPEAATADTRGKSVATSDARPTVPQPPRLRVEIAPIASASPEAQNAARPQTPSAVPKGAGMSIALQHSIMQTAQTQQATPEMAPIPAITSSLVAQPLGNFTETTSDGNSKGNSNSETPFDGQPVLPGSMTPTSPVEVSLLRPTSESFSAALEKTQHLQGVIHHVVETAERMRSDGRANVELQVPLNDGKNLTIQLHLSNGELSPVFKTDSAELREAIQQSWSQFTSSSSERGLRMTTPVFESPQSGMGDFNQRQSREQQHHAQARQSESFQLPTQSKPGTRSASLPRIPNPTQQPIGGMAVYA